MYCRTKLYLVSMCFVLSLLFGFLPQKLLRCYQHVHELAIALIDANIMLEMNASSESEPT